VVPLIATGIIAVFGWRSSYLIIGGLTLMILVAAAQVLRRDPMGIGLLPDGGSCDPCDAGVEERSMSLRAVAHSSQFWTICVAEFVIFFCLLTVIVHIVPHATDLGLPPASAAGVLSTIGGVSMVGRLVMGATNDRIGGKRSLIICFIVLLCGLFLLQIAKQVWMLFFFAAIYGFAHGGFFTVISPTVAELFGTSSHGLLFGIVLFIGTLGGAIGPLIAGHTFDVTGSYRIIFGLLTGLSVIGFALITLLRTQRGAGAQR
jgi:MFS family permease